MNYESLTLPELKRIAKERMMRLSFTKKAELIAQLQEWDERRRVTDERLRQRREVEVAQYAQRDGLRRQMNVLEHLESLEYPFSFLRSGEYDRVCDPLPGHAAEDIGTFPDNIAEYLWIKPGANDERPWLCLCRQDNGVHIYFRGECDYTGFDCQGNMQIYAHRDPNILIQMAMTATDYEAYVGDTVAIE